MRTEIRIFTSKRFFYGETHRPFVRLSHSIIFLLLLLEFKYCFRLVQFCKYLCKKVHIQQPINKESQLFEVRAVQNNEIRSEKCVPTCIVLINLQKGVQNFSFHFFFHLLHLPTACSSQHWIVNYFSKNRGSTTSRVLTLCRVSFNRYYRSSSIVCSYTHWLALLFSMELVQTHYTEIISGFFLL